MKRILLLAVLAIASLIITGRNLPAANPDAQIAYEDWAELDLNSITMNFVENKGQWNSDVAYAVQTTNAAFWFTQDKIIIDLVKQPNLIEEMLNTESAGIESQIDHLTLKISLLNASQNPKIIAGDLTSTRTNYFIGSNPDNWYTGLPGFSSINYEDVYPGIDIRYKGLGHNLVYEFVIEPYADYRNIVVEYEGIESIDIAENGDLIVHTEWGDFSEKNLFVYQDSGKGRIAINAEFVKISDKIFSFNIIDDYDRSKSLIIDPVLTFSTFFGGNGNDVSTDIALIDSTVYITGYTRSTDLPGTYGSYSESLSGDFDAFVARFYPDCQQIWYCTYLGGSARDEANAITVDKYGNAYVTGLTSSEDFPTQNAYQSELRGISDAFVAKLGDDGDYLFFSTYLGGNSSEKGNGIVIQRMMDGDYEIAVTGQTSSFNFPVTSGCLQSMYAGNGDAFVTRLAADGNSIMYSTFLGGSDSDAAFDITIGGLVIPGSLLPYYIVGNTNSNDFPTYKAHDPTYDGTCDVFVASVNGTCTGLNMSTYYGGSQADEGLGIVTSNDGLRIYITGATKSPDIETVADGDVYDPTYHGDFDAFIAGYWVFTGDLIISTYVGGDDIEICNDIMLNRYGIFITGATNSQDFPAVPYYKDDTPNGNLDVFVFGLNYDGTQLVYGVLVDGSNLEIGTGIVSDTSNAIYITGYTYSENYPTWNALYETFQGGSIDAFITKLLPYNPGDLNLDGKINVSDAVVIINYVFFGQEIPALLEAGDVNGDCLVNISDAVYLINYVFSGGDAPRPYCSNSSDFTKTSDNTVQINTNTKIDGINKNLEIDISSPIEYKAVQMEFKIIGEIQNIDIASKIDGMNLIEGYTESGYIVGSVDLSGMVNLPSGDYPALEIEYSGDGSLILTETVITDINGQTVPSTIVAKSSGLNVPTKFKLDQNWPNPFNPETEISYCLNEACDVTLEIYNIKGQKVACLINAYQEAGIYTVRWDGTDESGNKSASGVYLYRLTAGNSSESKKMILMK